MNKYKSESGFAHLVIIIALVLALVGSLGFIYWQNFIKQKPVVTDTLDEKAKSKTNVDAKTVSFNPSAKNPITFTYPADWTVERTITDGADDINTTEGSDTIKIFSPSKKVYVYLDYGILGGGFGFECSERDYNNYKSYSATDLVNYSGTSYVESVVNRVDNGYFYEAYLINPNTDAKTQPDGYCSSYKQNVIQRETKLAVSEVPGIYVIWGAKIKAVGLLFEDGLEKYFTDTTEIDALLISSDFITAKNILLSAKTTE